MDRLTGGVDRTEGNIMRPEGRFLAVAGIVLGASLAGVTGSTAYAADPPRGLVLHYSFDKQDPGELAADRSGQGNHGHPKGARWIAAGKVGGGCVLTSADSSIRVTGGQSSSAKQGTFALWFKTTRIDSTWRRILDGQAGPGFALAIGGGFQGQESRGRLAFTVGDGKPCLSNVVVTDGIWHHGAVTFDGENLRMYVDGQPQRQVIPCRTEIAALVNDLAIGMDRVDPSPGEKAQGFDGAIDELMIFNRALTVEEIKAMVVAVDPLAGKQRFSKQQVAYRLRQLKLLYEDGLITEDFYARKVAECEAAQ
jgi:hypothetical protein